MTPLTWQEEQQLRSMLAYYKQRLEKIPTTLKYDGLKVSALTKAIAYNECIKEIVNEQDNQGLPETSGSGGPRDAI